MLHTCHWGGSVSHSPVFPITSTICQVCHSGLSAVSFDRWIARKQKFKKIQCTCYLLNETMVLTPKHIQSWKEAKGYLNTVESWSALAFRHFQSSRSVTPGACARGSWMGVKRYLAQYTKSDFVITRTITDRIGRHELLSQLLNQQEVGRVVVIYDNHKLFRPRAVETDAFSASFVKSKGLTSSRRQFPEGYVFPLARSGKLTPRKHNGLQGKKALYILIL